MITEVLPAKQCLSESSHARICTKLRTLLQPVSFCMPCGTSPEILLGENEEISSLITNGPTRVK